MEEECKHLVPAGQCADCTPRSGGLAAFFAAPVQYSQRGPWFTAGYDSDCDGECGGRILEGEQCRADGMGGWLCSACGEE